MNTKIFFVLIVTFTFVIHHLNGSPIPDSNPGDDEASEITSNGDSPDNSGLTRNENEASIGNCYEDCDTSQIIIDDDSIPYGDSADPDNSDLTKNNNEASVDNCIIDCDITQSIVDGDSIPQSSFDNPENPNVDWINNAETPQFGNFEEADNSEGNDAGGIGSFTGIENCENCEVNQYIPSDGETLIDQPEKVDWIENTPGKLTESGGSDEIDGSDLATKGGDLGSNVWDAADKKWPVGKDGENRGNNKNGDFTNNCGTDCGNSDDIGNIEEAKIDSFGDASNQFADIGEKGIDTFKDGVQDFTDIGEKEIGKFDQIDGSDWAAKGGNIGSNVWNGADKKGPMRKDGENRGNNKKGDFTNNCGADCGNSDDIGTDIIDSWHDKVGNIEEAKIDLFEDEINQFADIGEKGIDTFKDGVEGFADIGEKGIDTFKVGVKDFTDIAEKGIDTFKDGVEGFTDIGENEIGKFDQIDGSDWATKGGDIGSNVWDGADKKWPVGKDGENRGNKNGDFTDIGTDIINDFWPSTR